MTEKHRVADGSKTIDHVAEGGKKVEIKCPCRLRDYMEDADCEKTLCCECCPIQNQKEADGK